MKRWISIALVIAALIGCGRGVVAQDDNAVNHEEYGNCHVWTDIDALTDKRKCTLACVEVGDLMDLLFPSAVTFAWKNGMPAVIFRVALASHFDSQIAVAWRIDKGEVRTDTWIWSSDRGFAATIDRGVFQTLLDELSAGKQIVIKIGNEQAVIALDGSAAAAQDFISRIAQHPAE